MSKAKKEKKAIKAQREEQALKAKIKAERQAAKRADRKKVFVGIIIGLATILTVGLILSVCLRPIPAIKMFDETDYAPDRIMIIPDGSFSATRTSGTIELSATHGRSEEYKNFLNAYKKSVSFTYASGILHQSWFPSLKITLDDDDMPTITVSQLGMLEGTAEQPLAVAVYDKKVTQKIKGIEISYDRVYFAFANTENNIREFKMYLVDSEKVNHHDPRIVEEYRAYQFIAKGNLSTIWDEYQNILNESL